MNREQLEHAIRTACQSIQHDEIIVVGSQAILGTFDEDELPAVATMSHEVDILPIADTNEETARLADVIEGAAGEWSLRGTARLRHRWGRPDDRDIARRLARPAGERAEHEHSTARRDSSVHRMVLGSA